MPVHRARPAAILGVFAYPPETVYSFRGDMQKPPVCETLIVLYKELMYKGVQGKCEIKKYTIFPFFTLICSI